MLRLFPAVEYAVFRETGDGWRIPRRMIDNHELVFVTGGRGAIGIEGRSVAVGAGDLLYFYPGLAHSLRVTEPPYMCFYAIHFTYSGADCPRLPLETVSHPDTLAPFIGPLGDLVRVWQRKPYLHAWRQDLLFGDVLCTLFEDLHRQTAPASLQKIHAALAYIHAHPTADIRLEELCAVSGMGKSHFMRQFREVTGSSPIRYGLRLRLDLSKAALLEGDDRVRAIAHDCGFSDESYYSRLFRQNFGLSPTEFRARNRGQFSDRYKEQVK